MMSMEEGKTQRRTLALGFYQLRYQVSLIDLILALGGSNILLKFLFYEHNVDTLDLLTILRTQSS